MTMTIGPVILTWYACDLRTGTILEELRSLKPSGALGRKLGVSTSAQFDLDLNGAPPSWESVTVPGRSLLVAVDNATALPIWAGIVLTRAGGSSNTVQLGAASPEAYLDRRYTGTYAGILQDQAVIMTGVAAPILVDAPPFTLDAVNTGTTTTYQVLDGDDKTILAAWQELMGQDGGPEWTCDTVWADAAMTRFSLPLRVRHQIGAQSATPDTVFDSPGCISDYTLTESYETGKGADDVLAWGDGSGSARLKSNPYIDTGLIGSAVYAWPRWQHRFTPSSGLTDPTQLNAHAASALAQMRLGSQAWTVEAVASRAPRVGSDWGLGDSIRIQVTQSPRHPAGADTVARCFEWQLDVGSDRVTPVLVQ